jgi:integrase
VSLTLKTVEIEYITFRKGSGRKPATILKDEQCLLALLTFYGDIPVEHITNLDAFFDPARWSSPSYRNSHVSVFRSFFEFCRKRGYAPLNFDPMYGLEFTPNPAKDKKYIPVEEFPALLDAAQNPRDRIIVALGLYLFVRQGEITGLRVASYDPEEKRIGVAVFKTNQFDRMQVNEELADELERWLRHYRRASSFVTPQAYLVPPRTPTQGQLTYMPTRPFSRPYRATQAALAAFGWTDEEIDGEGGHLLRRSGARALYFHLRDNLGNERAMALVQRRLHHANRAMTERYLGITAADSELDDLLLGKRMFDIPDSLATVLPFRRVNMD